MDAQDFQFETTIDTITLVVVAVISVLVSLKDRFAQRYRDKPAAGSTPRTGTALGDSREDIGK